MNFGWLEALAVFSGLVLAQLLIAGIKQWWARRKRRKHYQLSRKPPVQNRTIKNVGARKVRLRHARIRSRKSKRFDKR